MTIAINTTTPAPPAQRVAHRFSGGGRERTRPVGLTEHQDAPPDAATKAEQDKLRKSIDQVIGSVFFGPLMKTMRSGTLKGTIGHGGRGEEIFRAQLDQILVERAGSATRYELSDVLFDRFAPSVRRVSDLSRVEQVSDLSRVGTTVTHQAQ